MLKKLLLIFTFGLSFVSFAQDCPALLIPANGAANVPVNTGITWETVDGVPGYQIRLGTTPGGSEITDVVVGSATTYTPPLGLPENTEIFVTIVLSFFSQSGGSEDIVCVGQSFTTEDVTTAPACTQLRNPEDNAVDVSVFTNISWDYAPTATGYRITIGTAPGLGDIEIGLNVGNTLTYNSPIEFPANTTIYVRVVPYNENGDALTCEEFEFTTGEFAPLPGCSSLISPLNGAVNIPLTPFLEWQPVPNATGYRVTIGTTPDNADVLNEAVFTANSTFVIDFEPNRTFFIRITPFNDAGDAIGCGQETFSTLLGCGPFLDPSTGEFVDLNPQFEFPPIFSFCENDDPLVLTAPVIADGYRWFEIDQFGRAELLAEERSLTINERGQFQLEVYDLVTQPGDIIECATIVDFEVVSSELATIRNLRFEPQGTSNFRVTVETTGDGDYEYAIDNIDGPYQDSNIFNDVVPGTHTFYVRDKNGCGIVEETFEQDLTVEGFPKFFSPNGDNINDYWQFIQPEGQNIVLTSIQIFDRYGVFIQQIDQNSLGWDGTFNGRNLPASDYWFLAINDENKEFRGHFSLKR